MIWDLLHTVDVANTIITHDAGSPRDQLSPFWRPTEPLGYIGWGKTTQLGYGLGLAMGAKLAQPGQAVHQRLGRRGHRLHGHGLRDGGASAFRSPISLRSKKSKTTLSSIGCALSFACSPGWGHAAERVGLLNVHPHTLRHSCGYYLADKGTDLRTMQDYLGHRDPRHTVHYTRVAGRRFEGLWK